MSGMSLRKLTLAAAVATIAATGAQAQEASLILATLTPADNPASVELYRPWAQRVEAASNGTLRIDVRDGAAIANLANAPDRLDQDVIQVTEIIPASHPGKMPLTEIAGLPLIAKNGEIAAVAMWRLYKTGLLDAELKNYVPLWFHTFGISGIHLAKEPPSVTDLRGLKISISNKIQSDTISDLGGAPLFFSPPDVYEAINRGTVAGVITSLNTFPLWRYAEVTTFHIDVAFSTPTSIFAMTRKRYDALPAAARAALDGISGEELSRRAGKSYDRQNQEQHDIVAKGKGQTIVALDAAQERVWREKTAPIADDWVKSHPGGGDKVLSTYRALVAAVEAGK